jgi:hypothetical protein
MALETSDVMVVLGAVGNFGSELQELQWHSADRTTAG